MSDIVPDLRFYGAKRKWPKGLHVMPYLLTTAADEITRLRTALSEAEQREKDAESNLNEEISHRKKLQAALLFWMPSVTEEIEISTNGRCGDDAGLLAGYDGPIDESCWGDEIIVRAQRARREALGDAAQAIFTMGAWYPTFADKRIPCTFDEGTSAAYEIVRELEGQAERALIPSEPHDAEGRE